MLLNLILLCLRCFSVAAGPSASTFAGATTAFQYPPNVTAVPTSDFPDESEVGFGGPTPSTSRFSYCHSLTNSTFFQLGMKRWLSRRHRPSHQWMTSIRLWHLLLSTAMSKNSTYSATSEIFHQWSQFLPLVCPKRHHKFPRAVNWVKFTFFIVMERGIRPAEILLDLRRSLSKFTMPLPMVASVQQGL